MDKQIGYGRLAVAFLLTSALFNDCCVGARLGTSSNNGMVAARKFSNTTESVLSTRTSSSVLPPSTSLSSSLPTITAAATLTNALTTDNSSSTMTTAPEWGNQSIPLNTCSTIDDSQGGQTFWTPCHVFAGTVQLSFFPEASGDVSYPTTYYDSKLSATLTSPSIYMVVNTIFGYNDCGDLGPVYATKLLSMDLTDVYTLPPYAHATATSRGDPQPLTLADLENCTSTKTQDSHGATTTNEVSNSHPVNSTYNRCNPRLVFPIQLKRAGYPYWKHCGNDHYNIGLFDPPGAVPSVDGLFTCVPPITSTTEVISPAPTAVSDLASSTQVQEQVSSTQPAEASPTSDAEQPPVTPVEQNPTTSDAPSEATLLPLPETTPGGSLVQTSVPPLSTASPDILTVIGSNTIIPISGSGSGVLLGSSTATVGQIATLTDAAGSKAVISVEASGIFISGSDSKATFLANPTQAPSTNVVAMIAGQTISAAPGDSTIVIGSQTASMNGNAITLDNHDVVSVGPSGVVVQYPGGAVSTIALGSSASSSAAAALTSTTTNKLAVASALGSSASSGTVAASTSTTTNKVAVAIASIIGGGASPSSADNSSTPSTTGSLVLATGAAEMIRGKTVSALGSLLLAFVFAL